MRALTMMLLAPSSAEPKAAPAANEAPAEVSARSFDHNVGEQKADAKHNVGQCGCAQCGATGPRVVVGPPLSYPLSFSNPQTGALNVTMPTPSSTPYQNEADDIRCMTPVSSGAPQTIAAGASALITIGPTRGMLDMYYLKIVGLNPATGLEVDPASYRLTPPRVADCPQPCDTTAMRGAFYRGTGEGCCGCQWRAIVGRNADGEAMTFTITNDGVASATFQAVARGFCIARNLCISC